MYYGALETGGTKMVCAIGTEDGRILERISLPTRTPEETLPEIIGFFRRQEIAALGVASFGPLDLDPASPTYGSITSTPKPGWSHCSLMRILSEALQVPVGLDTDVNGSLLGETTYGASRGITDAIYITVGTGIGGGILSGGHIVHGMMHPELGHIRVTPHPQDTYPGICPFHGCCLEGMASGPAIKARWGADGSELTERDEVWELEAWYLGQALATLILTLSPKRIILGGGVMHQSRLFQLIRSVVKKELNGYLHTVQLDHIDDYIVPASLGDDQGILGCIRLAIDACL